MPPRDLVRALAALLAFAVAPAAVAADLTVTVTDDAGRPVRDAVVLVPAPPGSGGALKPSGPMTVAQKDLQFRPFVLIAPVGAKVAFPNEDAVRHHVYSFSPAKTFDLKLYGKDESRSVTFDKVGVVPLGCNIHDSMSAYVRVVDTPWAVKTDARGIATLKDVPASARSLIVWHPWVKGGRDLTRMITPPAAGGLSLGVTLSLKAPPMPHDAY